jgi:hypothetical protein
MFAFMGLLWAEGKNRLGIRRAVSRQVWTDSPASDAGHMLQRREERIQGARRLALKL